MATFMLVRVYAYQDKIQRDLGEYATVETRGGQVIGHPGSYQLLEASGEGWRDPDGRQYDRFETTTVYGNRNGGDS